MFSLLVNPLPFMHLGDKLLPPPIILVREDAAPAPINTVFQEGRNNVKKYLCGKGLFVISCDASWLATVRKNAGLEGPLV